MRQDMLILLLIAAAIAIVLLTRPAGASPEQPSVRVQMGAHGARIDYEAEAAGVGCCG